MYAGAVSVASNFLSAQWIADRDVVQLICDRAGDKPVVERSGHLVQRDRILQLSIVRRTVTDTIDC